MSQKNSTQYIAPENGNVFNALLGDYRWACEPGQKLTLTYSFYDLDSPLYLTAPFGYDASDPDYDLPFRPGFGAFSPAQQAATRSLFDDIETLINVEFVAVSDGLQSDIRLGLTDLDLEQADGLVFSLVPKLPPFEINPAEFHESSGLAGDIWLDLAVDADYFTEVLVHEVGHALGLSHPFEDGFQEINGVDFVILDGELDYNRYTAMAYDFYPDSVRPRDVLFTSTVATLMPLDVEALRFLYGPSLDEGDDLYVIDEYDGDFDINSLDYPGYGLHPYINSYITLADTGGSNVLLFDLNVDLRIELDSGEWSATRGGLLTQAFADDNFYLTPDTVLSELHFTGSGTHAVSLDGKSYSHYKFVQSSAGITVAEIAGELSVLIVGADELIFADATFDVAAIFEDIAQRNQPLLLSADGPLYQSAVAGTAAGVTDTPALAAQLYRLYYGGLGRAPDQGGYDWWLQQVTGAVYDFNEVAARFIDSAEFRSLADVNGDGSTSDSEFLDHLYFNVFGREPDAAGYAFWSGELSSGQFTQPAAFANMVQSDEFVILTAATVGDFIFL